MNSKHSCLSSMVLFVVAAAVSGAALAQGAPQDATADLPLYPKIKIETTMGSLVVELDRKRAPLTVASFARYINEGFYNGTIFHRVINGFVAQGGGHLPDFSEKETHEPVVNESGNGLRNVRGTVAMARAGDPHSALSQFYFNLAECRSPVGLGANRVFV